MLKYILAAIFVLLAQACSNPSWDEVGRVASPTGKLDGVILESSGGATTSYDYEVHVVEKGAQVEKTRPIANLYGATRSKTAYGANLRWDSESILIIEYFKAKSKTAKTQPMLVGGVEVQVILIGGVVDANAPDGGMLYNSGGRK